MSTEIYVPQKIIKEFFGSLASSNQNEKIYIGYGIDDY
jgi:hypothetical protein